MGGAVVENHPQAGDREADDLALLHAGPEALLHRRDVLRGNRPAADLVEELELAGLVRLQVTCDAAVLPRTAGLLLVGVVELDSLADGLAESHLRLSGLYLGLVLALHALDVDLQVQFAHAGDDGLTRLLVDARAERRVLLAEAL